MKHPFQACACLITALYLLGGHWGMLQVVAWTQMLHDYSKTQSVLTAVKYTFDGTHPCSMCLKIDESRQQEQKEPTTIPTSHLEKNTLWLTAHTFTTLPDQNWPLQHQPHAFTTAPLSHSQWASIPDTPPPRQA